MSKPILCLDFDGVCSTYESGWQGADVCNDPPVPGLFEFLEEANKYFTIDIYSSRSNQPGGLEAMKNWFTKYYKEYICKKYPVVENTILGCPWVFFANEKPSAFLTLDDRALTFIGTWPSIEELKNFQPWFKKIKKQEE